jgi:hypothetical protein
MQILNIPMRMNKIASICTNLGIYHFVNTEPA